MDLSGLTSITAVLAVTTIIISLIKGGIAKNTFLAKIPMLVYSIIIAIGLTLVAVYVTKTMTGNISQLVVAVVLASIGAVGFHVDSPSAVGQSVLAATSTTVVTTALPTVTTNGPKAAS